MIRHPEFAAHRAHIRPTFETDSYDTPCACSEMSNLILSFSSGHDGAIAAVRDGDLLFSVEPEHDAGPRYGTINTPTLMSACSLIDGLPDIIASGGWVKEGAVETGLPIETAYLGLHEGSVVAREMSFFGRRLKFFSSSHERSHVWGAYGASPYPQGQPVYVLTWEGFLGNFYEVGSDLHVVDHGRVLKRPGERYAFLFSLADPQASGVFRHDQAGKLMALAGIALPQPSSASDNVLVDTILKAENCGPALKEALKSSPYYNIGVETPEFRRLARTFSDELFQIFFEFARRRLDKRLPLLITGGCGLNCSWNTRWRDSGLFSDVFVSPVANDAGASIGTAVDAQRHYTGHAKISWSVYSGAPFRLDREPEGWIKSPLHYPTLCRHLLDGDVIAWVQGRCEIGPRALGNRSILAAPFDRAMRDRLNVIKQRESYRPIAPICLEEDVARYFRGGRKSPHMLYFYDVLDPRLQAITHDDGTARPQTVNRSENPRIYDLLEEFRRASGYGVLCNTSLNFKGTGFINSIGDLSRFCAAHGVEAFVIEDTYFRRADTSRIRTEGVPPSGR